MAGQRRFGLFARTNSQNNHLQAAFRVRASEPLSRFPSHVGSLAPPAQLPGTVRKGTSPRSPSSRKGEPLRWKTERSRAGTDRAALQREPEERRLATPMGKGKERCGGISRIPPWSLSQNGKGPLERISLLCAPSKNPAGLGSPGKVQKTDALGRGCHQPDHEKSSTLFVVSSGT